MWLFSRINIKFSVKLLNTYALLYLILFNNIAAVGLRVSNKLQLETNMESKSNSKMLEVKPDFSHRIRLKFNTPDKYDG